MEREEHGIENIKEDEDSGGINRMKQQEFRYLEKGKNKSALVLFVQKSKYFLKKIFNFIQFSMT